MKRYMLEAWTNIVIVAVLCTVGFCALVNEAAVTVFGENGITWRGTGGDEKTISILLCADSAGFVDTAINALNEQHVHASFVLCGAWVQQNGDAVRKIRDSGNEIINGGWDDVNYATMSVREIKNQLARANRVIKSASNEKPTLFMPFSNNENPSAVKASYRCGMDVVLCNVDTIDLYDTNTWKIGERVKRNLKPGTFVLMHANQAFGANLIAVVTAATSAGYSFSTAGEMVEKATPK